MHRREEYFYKVLKELNNNNIGMIPDGNEVYFQLQIKKNMNKNKEHHAFITNLSNYYNRPTLIDKYFLNYTTFEAMAKSLGVNHKQRNLDLASWFTLFGIIIDQLLDDADEIESIKCLEDFSWENIRGAFSGCNIMIDSFWGSLLNKTGSSYFMLSHDCTEDIKKKMMSMLKRAWYAEYISKNFDLHCNKHIKKIHIVKQKSTLFVVLAYLFLVMSDSDAFNECVGYFQRIGQLVMLMDDMIDIYEDLNFYRPNSLILDLLNDSHNKSMLNEIEIIDLALDKRFLEEKCIYMGEVLNDLKGQFGDHFYQWIQYYLYSWKKGLYPNIM